MDEMSGIRIVTSGCNWFLYFMTDKILNYDSPTNFKNYTTTGLVCTEHSVGTEEIR